MKHLPNILTIGRILLVPIYLLLLLEDNFWTQVWALTIFVIAAISDWADGHLARLYKVSSRLGQFLDPLADKILVLSIFIVLPFVLKDPGLVPWWAVAIIVVRDVGITGLRMYAEYWDRPLKTVSIAKLKTTVQYTYAIFVMGVLVATKVPSFPEVQSVADSILYSSFTYWFLMFVAALTLYTGIFYFVRRPVSE